MKKLYFQISEKLHDIFKGMPGIRGPMGPPGQAGLPGTCSADLCRSESSQNDVTNFGGSPNFGGSSGGFVAFTAGLSKNFTRTSANKGVVVFDKIQLKYPLGTNGYSHKNGIFTAPTSGIKMTKVVKSFFVHKWLSNSRSGSHSRNFLNLTVYFYFLLRVVNFPKKASKYNIS